MQEQLQELPQRAKDKAQETKRFFKQLKKRPPKHLDSAVQEIHDTVFETTDCLACAQCCKTTGPLFERKDIDRLAKYLRMKPAEFEAKYLRVDEDNDWVLQTLPCPFLGENNHCMVYDVRPKACREFPHTDRKKIYQIADITAKNMAICPAAFAIVEKMKERLS